MELKAALAEAMRLATEVNKYLEVHAPWFEIKTDKNEAAKSLFTAIQAIDWLKIMFAPSSLKPAKNFIKSCLMKHLCSADPLRNQSQTRLALISFLGLLMKSRWLRQVQMRGPRKHWKKASLSISLSLCSRNLTTALLKKNAQNWASRPINEGFATMLYLSW